MVHLAGNVFLALVFELRLRGWPPMPMLPVVPVDQPAEDLPPLDSRYRTVAELPGLTFCWSRASAASCR